MGLVFALQPDLRKSNDVELVLRSNPRRFSIGMAFLFGAALLATMHSAAAPLFEVFWNEGNFFDKALTSFIYFSIYSYPAVALACWFYQERVCIRKRDNDFLILVTRGLPKITWFKKEFAIKNVEDLRIENWKGAVNMAALERNPTRYATKGHWMLKAVLQQEKQDIVIEKRAKKEDIEDLYLQIKQYFTSANPTVQTF